MFVPTSATAAHVSPQAVHAASPLKCGLWSAKLMTLLTDFLPVPIQNARDLYRDTWQRGVAHRKPKN